MEWIPLLEIFLKFWYDAGKLRHEIESSSLKAAECILASGTFQ
jgi:hypothetical protein